MNQLNQNLYHRHFSHLYIERDAIDYADTQKVVNQFPNAKTIFIDNYKEVFDRSNQDWRAQKKSQSLILAVRRDSFLYKGTDIAPDFGNHRFFYNSLVLNCLYDCDYCYLQGMFSSAHAVLFVNNGDFQQAVKDELHNGPIYLAISYDTDLLAFESILPYCERWITFAGDHQQLTVELRTKSSNYRAISSLNPVDNVVLAWTLSPPFIADKYEPKTPSFKARLRAVKAAIHDGWDVRLCFDPLLYVDNWQDIYGNMIHTLHQELDLNSIRDYSIGVFRMPSNFLREIRSQRSDTEIIYYPYEAKNGVVSYPEQLKNKMVEYVYHKLAEKVNPQKIDVL